MTKYQKILAEFRSNSTLTKKIYDRTMEPLCSQYHISRMELDILLFLANNPGYDTAKDIVCQKRFTKSHVSTSLHLLEEKDRQLIQLRYFKGKTQVETAAALGMTQVQVSRREKKILLKMRELLL